MGGASGIFLYFKTIALQELDFNQINNKTESDKSNKSDHILLKEDYHKHCSSTEEQYTIDIAQQASAYFLENKNTKKSFLPEAINHIRIKHFGVYFENSEISCLAFRFYLNSLEDNGMLQKQWPEHVVPSKHLGDDIAGTKYSILMSMLFPFRSAPAYVLLKPNSGILTFCVSKLSKAENICIMIWWNKCKLGYPVVRHGPNRAKLFSSNIWEMEIRVMGLFGNSHFTRYN
ncbi:hypothetical protein HHI36_014181 [Cryptolaemus montrouzieri]|uniref:Uncharacterized protein n=1 Tax=Cryptolaemus montrouzieri TaxID=559131 RepID=A0ABD2N341_9CUCU